MQESKKFAGRPGGCGSAGPWHEVILLLSSFIVCSVESVETSVGTVVIVYIFT